MATGMELSIPDTLLLSPDLVDFMLGPVSIKIGSCSAARIPSVAQAFGCQVASDRRKVCVFVSESRCAAVLRDLRAGGAVAVVFSRPQTHRTLQLKAPIARIEPLLPGDQALIDLHGQRTTRELTSLGYPLHFAQGVMTMGDSQDAVRVCFEPAVAFDQTPGAGAGMQLEIKP